MSIEGSLTDLNKTVSEKNNKVLSVLRLLLKCKDIEKCYNWLQNLTKYCSVINNIQAMCNSFQQTGSSIAASCRNVLGDQVINNIQAVCKGCLQQAAIPVYFAEALKSINKTLLEKMVYCTG
ncbi:uncharacterized protein LOC106702095 [Latimeria chalumnae]|uniref:uncharacterized protein LOC106702095 n=1 Tax=Latimeria chalumnae TaxID=7897 RepID=UPI00313C47C6